MVVGWYAVGRAGVVAGWLWLWSVQWVGGGEWPGANVVLIVADDLGYGELSCQGCEDLPTPGIDRLAWTGVRFTQAYATSPYCAPSRAGLLTGRYQQRFGCEFNPVGAANADPASGLPGAELTLAEVLRDRGGYATGLVGKWHLGASPGRHPLRHGFAEFFGFLHEGHFFAPPPYEGMVTWVRRLVLPGGGNGRWTSADGRWIESTHMGHGEPDYDADNPIYRGGQPVEEPEYLTGAFTREALDFIRRHGERPFFLMVSYSAVHSPLQAPEAEVGALGHIDDVQRRIFGAMLGQMDRGVGELLDELERGGLRGRTVVVFLSDNGGATRELSSSNGVLRGEKGGFYEGGLRVPMLMSWPGQLPEGVVEGRVVSALDLWPTLVAAAGLELDEGERGRLDGRDLLPYLRDGDKGEIRRRLYWRMGERGALREGQWKIVKAGRGDPGWELYDLEGDVGERDDVAARHPEIARGLAGAWEAMGREIDAERGGEGGR